MELHAVVDDLFVTASLALLLTFLVLKLVEAMNDTHATPKRHVRREPVPHGERLTVQPAQSKSTLGSINPVQAVTCVGTEHQIPMEEAKVEPACPVPGGKRLTVQPAQNKSEVQAATCVQAEHKIEEATVEPVPPVQAAQSKSTVGFIRPVQVATCVETEHKKEEATVESDYNVVVVSPGESDPDIVVKEEINGPDEETTQEFDKKRNVESADEISVKPSTETEVSVVDSVVKENDDDDDDWEGIERSELEKEFMAATEFVTNEGDRLGSVGSNVRMELYGFRKVATEGPCRDPRPMPLKISARAKWNAWQKLGNLSPEVAMEQYISLLSDKFPGWMKDTSAGMRELEPSRPEVSDSAASDLSTTLSHQQMIITERELEQESDSKDRSPLTEPDLENNVKK